MQEKRSVTTQRFENIPKRNDFFIDLTIHDIPMSLIEDFGQHVIKPTYKG